MPAFVPRRMFLTKGVGVARTQLESFEAALRKAGIAHLNLVRVSSIYPANCRIVSRRAVEDRLHPGMITFCVLSEISTNEPNRMIAAGIGLALPEKRDARHGYIAELHSHGLTERKCADQVEDMAASMLATTMGLHLDPDTDYDERRAIYRSSGLVIRTRAIVQAARGDKNGRWTTVCAAAVFVD